MVAHRAEMIAHTESLRSVSRARHQAWRQIADQAGFDDDRVRRTWMATLDERTRDTHAEMNGQMVQGFEPFESPSGALLMHPGSAAPPEETINCRCVETYDIV
jgi:uncharacterized protein with gpF-like domain